MVLVLQTKGDALDAVEELDEAIIKISEQRAGLGAVKIDYIAQ